jgi:hypothetical protein
MQRNFIDRTKFLIVINEVCQISFNKDKHNYSVYLPEKKMEINKKAVPPKNRLLKPS